MLDPPLPKGTVPATTPPRNIAPENRQNYDLGVKLGLLVKPHINGKIPKALAQVADDLLASAPDIRPIEVVAVK
jgi:hypothetical protein